MVPDRADHSELAGGWGLVWALAFMQIISWGSTYYSFSLFVVPMEQELGWSRVAVNGALSLGLLVQGLCSYFVGAWIDRRGGGTLMAAGSLLGALMLALWSRIESIWMLYGVWAGLGMMMAATFYDPLFAVLARSYPQSYRKRITVTTLVGGFASTVYVPLTQVLISLLGWREALLVLALTNLLVAAPVHGWGLNDRTKPGGMLQSQPASAAPAANHDALTRALRHPVFWCLATCFTAYYVAFSALIFHIVPLLSERGYSAAAIAGAFVVFGPSQVAARLGLLALPSDMRSETMGRLALLSMPIATLLLLMVPSSGWTPFVFFALLGAGNGLVTILRGTVVPDLLWKDGYGAINGALSAPSNMARAIAPSAAAALWHVTQSYSPVLWTTLSLSAAALAAFLLAVALAARHGPQ